MDWCAKVTRDGRAHERRQPEQTSNAIAFGADGIGLTRTEHMFFEGDRIDAMREMILAENVEEREKALAKLLPYQREDFAGIFQALKGFPATIRFLDPPLHEFLPHDEKSQQELAQENSACRSKIIAQRVAELHEFNPMLGHRGCRLGIASRKSPRCRRAPSSKPPRWCRRKASRCKPEIMIPLVGFKKELDLQIEVVHASPRRSWPKKKVKLELSGRHHDRNPARRADRRRDRRDGRVLQLRHQRPHANRARHEPRRHAARFLPHYAELEIVKKNPFATIDQTGVGELMQIAIEKGRKTRPDIKLGICGEHGGDPDSVKFCHSLGLTYVSCSRSACRWPASPPPRPRWPTRRNNRPTK